MGKPTKRCTRVTTDAGPPFCKTCSDIIHEYVQWDGHTEREALLIQYLEPYLNTGFRWNPKGG